jgi:hypothetical protein
MIPGLRKTLDTIIYENKGGSLLSLWNIYGPKILKIYDGWPTVNDPHPVSLNVYAVLDSGGSL